MANKPDWPQWVIVAAIYLTAALIFWATLADFSLGSWLQQINLP